MSTLTDTPPSEIPFISPEAFAESLEAHRGLPGWWLDQKRAAWERHLGLPYPKRINELWRFSNIRAWRPDTPYPIAAEAAGLPANQAGIENRAGQLTFVNDRLVAREDLPDELTAKGVVFTTLEEALVRHGDLIREHFMAQPDKLGSEKFSSLHRALVRTGAFVFVPRGVEIDLPLCVFSSVGGEHSSIFPHTLVIAEDNAKATVLDLRVSLDDGKHFACGVNDLYAGAGARVTYLSAQNWSPTTRSYQANDTVVQRDGRASSLSLHLGGILNRHESHSQLQGPGSFSEMLALVVATGEQEFDLRTLQSHQAPNTGSDLLYKHALLDKARTVFSGLIIVEPEGQKTDAYQSNRNLLLSNEAEANSLPGLEIKANDVRCTHGSTSGRIDEDQLFYLRSRGIHDQAARLLLVFGFFEEVLNRLENDEAHSLLSNLIQSKFR